MTGMTELLTIFLTQTTLPAALVIIGVLVFLVIALECWVFSPVKKEGKK